MCVLLPILILILKWSSMVEMKSADDKLFPTAFGVVEIRSTRIKHISAIMIFHLAGISETAVRVS